MVIHTNAPNSDNSDYWFDEHELRFILRAPSPQVGDAHIISFIVGDPSPYRYEGIATYRDVDEVAAVAPDWPASVALLMAGMGALHFNDVFNIAGVGSVRRMQDGCLYFRLYG